MYYNKFIKIKMRSILNKGELKNKNTILLFVIFPNAFKRSRLTILEFLFNNLIAVLQDSVLRKKKLLCRQNSVLWNFSRCRTRKRQFLTLSIDLASGMTRRTQAAFFSELWDTGLTRYRHLFFSPSKRNPALPAVVEQRKLAYTAFKSVYAV